jgi:hypothetical protein
MAHHFLNDLIYICFNIYSCSRSEYSWNTAYCRTIYNIVTNADLCALIARKFVNQKNYITESKNNCNVRSIIMYNLKIKRHCTSKCKICNVLTDSFISFQLPVQSVPITTKVASSNPIHGEMYSIQHYVIKFVSDLQQVCGFLWVLWFPQPIKLTATI